MNDIKVYAELNWAIERPNLIFRFNNQSIDSNLEIVSNEGFVERVIYKIQVDQLLKENTFEIELINKTDQLTTTESDHWVSIKDIEIDNIRADWTMLPNTVFKHRMPVAWVEDMKSQGHDILPEYSPGTEMRLNGVCTFNFTTPFAIYRLLELWKLEP
jgi:hypothetical protein